MTAQVRIRRLNVRVLTRAAPWATRAELARAGERVRMEVLAGLERTLRDALSGLPDGTRLGVIDVAVAAEPRQADGTVPISRAGLGARVDTALQHALKQTAQRMPHDAAHRAPADRDSERAAGPVQAPHEPALEPGDAAWRLITLLVGWHDEGRLAGRLALLPLPLLHSWLAISADVLDPEPTEGPRSAAALQRDLAMAPGIAMAAAQGDHAEVTAVVAKLVALVARLAGDSPRAGTETEVPSGSQVADRARSAGARSSTGAAAAGDAETPRERPVRSQPASRASRLQSEAAWRAHKLPARRDRPQLPARAALETCLPFLLLGPLSRIDWLGAAAALLGERGGAAHAQALGFALALKGLPAATPLTLSAAFAAGSPEPLPSRALLSLERALGAQLPALDASVTDALARGHDPLRPLYLLDTAHGLALIDPEGLFPLALGSPRELAPVMRALAVPLLIEHHASSLAAQLAAAGFEVERSRLDTALLRRALGSQRALGEDRSLPCLERSTTLASALALGDVAWRLHARDPVAWAEPDPSLALERFGDLSGIMTVTDCEVSVRLPLGPRARDLEAAGLLADVGSVPWLAGRRLRFGIG